MTLSYNQLYDLVRRERSHQELQELAVDFYVEVQQLFQELAVLAAAEPFAAKAESARSQLVNAKKLFKQLYEAREQKILHLSQHKCRTGSVDTSKLAEPELVLFERLVLQLSHSRSMLGLDDAPEPPRIQKPELITVKVLKPMPQFLGAGMETYGPFAENETVSLPEPVAQVLIRKGTAQQE